MRVPVHRISPEESTPGERLEGPRQSSSRVQRATSGQRPSREGSPARPGGTEKERGGAGEATPSAGPRPRPTGATRLPSAGGDTGGGGRSPSRSLARGVARRRLLYLAAELRRLAGRIGPPAWRSSAGLGRRAAAPEAVARGAAAGGARAWHARAHALPRARLGARRAGPVSPLGEGGRGLAPCRCSREGRSNLTFCLPALNSPAPTWAHPASAAGFFWFTCCLRVLPVRHL